MEVKLTDLQFSGPFFFAILQAGVTFAFFQPSGVHLYHCDIWALAGISAIPLTCILSGAMGLYVSRWLQRSFP